MAQSKKEALKTVRRQCRIAGQRLQKCQALDILLLDTYKELCQDIGAAFEALHGVPSGALELVPLCITYHDVNRLRQRLAAFQQSLDPAARVL